MLSKMLKVANALFEWNNFHSVTGFFVSIQAFSATSGSRKHTPC